MNGVGNNATHVNDGTVNHASCEEGYLLDGPKETLEFQSF